LLLIFNQLKRAKEGPKKTKRHNVHEFAKINSVF
jgi:hypothetical protein